MIKLRLKQRNTLYGDLHLVLGTYGGTIEIDLGPLYCLKPREESSNNLRV